MGCEELRRALLQLNYSNNKNRLLCLTLNLQIQFLAHGIADDVLMTVAMLSLFIHQRENRFWEWMWGMWGMSLGGVEI